MQVVGDDLRLHCEETPEMLDPIGERTQGLVVLEVADVVADPGARPLGQAEGVLQLRAACEDWRDGAVARQGQRGRDVTARAAQNGTPRNRADDRVVGARCDRAVVDEKQVRDLGKPPERVLIAVGDRFLADVCARHHERDADVGQQQVVKRRVRKHHAELGSDGRDGPGDRRIAAARGEHDRPRGTRHELPPGAVERHE